MQSWSVDSWILSVAQSDNTDTFLSLRQKMSETFGIPEEGPRWEKLKPSKRFPSQ